MQLYKIINSKPSSEFSSYEPSWWIDWQKPYHASSLSRRIQANSIVYNKKIETRMEQIKQQQHGRKLLCKKKNA